MFERTSSNRNDPWIKSREKFAQYFFCFGPAWMTDDDLENGQLGQSTRDTIRDLLFIELYADGKINLKTLIDVFLTD